MTYLMPLVAGGPRALALYTAYHVGGQTCTVNTETRGRFIPLVLPLYDESRLSI